MTIFFDVTDILGFAAINPVVTGIQRGSLRIIGGAYENGYDVSGFVRHPLTGEFRAADLSFLAGGYDFSREDFLSRFEIDDPKALWMQKKLSKYRGWSRVPRALYLKARYAVSSKTHKKISSFSAVKNESCLRNLVLKKGDTLASLGGWGVDYVGMHALAIENGCYTAAFVHDIFHITNQMGDYKGFRPWLMFCFKNFDIILCNSNYTKSKLDEYLRGVGIKANVCVSLYPHEFVSPKPIDATRGYALCVGTQSERKNIPRLVYSWLRVRGELGDRTPTLVVAGAKTPEVRACCLNTPGVTFIEHPSDVVLEQLYRGCLFTVFPSREEGWGIPIGESLWFGKPVLCASVSSMPEVGGGFADYFDPSDPDGLLNGIKHMIDNPRQFPESIRSELRTWNDTAAALVGQIESLGERSGASVSEPAPRERLSAVA